LQEQTAPAPWQSLAYCNGLAPTSVLLFFIKTNATNEVAD
jgi:hypothetical protein